MRSEKLFILIFVIPLFLSCTKGEKQTNYLILLNIKEIFLDGNSFQFNPVKTLTLKPNSDAIEKVSLDGERNVGVKYFLSEQVDPEGIELVHNAVFYEFVNGNWKPITELDHREPAKLDPNTYWRITTTVDGIQRFSVTFDYTITTR